MTVHLVAPNGRSATVYVPGARTENSAVRSALVMTDLPKAYPAWILPGDAR